MLCGIIQCLAWDLASRDLASSISNSEVCQFLFRLQDEQAHLLLWHIKTSHWNRVTLPCSSIPWERGEQKSAITLFPHSKARERQEQSTSPVAPWTHRETGPQPIWVGSSLTNFCMSHLECEGQMWQLNLFFHSLFPYVDSIAEWQ